MNIYVKLSERTKKKVLSWIIILIINLLFLLLVFNIYMDLKINLLYIINGIPN